MTFLNFSQLPESVFRQNKKENTFLKTKLNFSLTWKCFPLTNFPNSKQTQKNLESGFLEITFQETNTPQKTKILITYSIDSLLIYFFPKSYKPTTKVVKNIFLTRHWKCKINSDREIIRNFFSYIVQAP
jgi:hypothetical protein